MHIAQLMPLPLTVSCDSKIQIRFAFLVRAHPGSPGQTAVKRQYVCISILYRFRDKASYLSKVADLTYPTSIWRPHWGDV